MSVQLPSELEVVSAYVPQVASRKTESERHRVWLFPAGSSSDSSVTMMRAVAEMSSIFYDLHVMDRPGIADYKRFMRSMMFRYTVPGRYSDRGKYSPFRLQPSSSALLERAHKRDKTDSNLEPTDLVPIAELLGHKVSALDIIGFAGHVLTYTALEGLMGNNTDPRLSFLDGLRAETTPSDR